MDNDGLEKYHHYGNRIEEITMLKVKKEELDVVILSLIEHEIQNIFITMKRRKMIKLFWYQQ